MAKALFTPFAPTHMQIAGVERRAHQEIRRR